MTSFVASSGPEDAPCVVLLHGVGTSGWMWQRLAAVLDRDLHVLVPDLPGHGRSNAQRWTSVADTVAALADLIAARAAHGRAHVVGLSLGGYIAAQLAADRPDVVDSAVLSGVSVLPFPHPTLMRTAGLLMAPFMTSGPVLRANVKALGVPPEDVPAYLDAARAMARGTFRRVGGELMTFRVPERAAASPARVLAVAGGNEHPLVLRSLAELAAGYPNGEACIAPGVGHAWSGEAPELFAAMVRAQVEGEQLPAGLVPVPA